MSPMKDRAASSVGSVLLMVGVASIVAAGAYFVTAQPTAETTSSTLAFLPPVAENGTVAYAVATNVTGLSWDRLTIKLTGATGAYGIAVTHAGKTAPATGIDWKGTTQLRDRTPITAGDVLRLTSPIRQGGVILVVQQGSDGTVLLQAPVNGLG
mgnify:CR=1 FL=1